MSSGVVGDVSNAQRGVGLCGRCVDASRDLAVWALATIVGIDAGVVGSRADQHGGGACVSDGDTVFAVVQRAVLGDDEDLCFVPQPVVGQRATDGESSVVDVCRGAVVRGVEADCQRQLARLAHLEPCRDDSGGIAGQVLALVTDPVDVVLDPRDPGGEVEAATVVGRSDAGVVQVEIEVAERLVRTKGPVTLPELLGEQIRRELPMRGELFAYVCQDVAAR
jgi:hypothetical protein